MSRRCTKRNHLFLNWLKANRSRFVVEPRIMKIKGQNIQGYFSGVTPAIRFQVWKGGIVVDVFWEKKCWDLIGDFDIAERRSGQGFFCALCLPEAVRYFPAKEALWTAHAFEPFLAWVNKTLAVSRWLAIYEYGCGSSEAKLQRDDKPMESPALQELLRYLEPLDGRESMQTDKDVTQKVVQIVPVFKAERAGRRGEHEAGI
jgi:hypothetical protein